MGTALSKTADTWNEIINDNRGRQDSANKKSQEMAEGVVIIFRNMTLLSAITDKLMLQTGCIFYLSIVSIQCTTILSSAIQTIVFLTDTIKIRSKVLTLAL